AREFRRREEGNQDSPEPDTGSGRERGSVLRQGEERRRSDAEDDDHFQTRATACPDYDTRPRQAGVRQRQPRARADQRPDRGGRQAKVVRGGSPKQRKGERDTKSAKPRKERVGLRGEPYCGNQSD